MNKVQKITLFSLLTVAFLSLNAMNREAVSSFMYQVKTEPSSFVRARIQGEDPNTGKPSGSGSLGAEWRDKYNKMYNYLDKIGETVIFSGDIDKKIRILKSFLTKTPSASQEQQIEATTKCMKEIRAMIDKEYKYMKEQFGKENPPFKG